MINATPDTAQNYRGLTLAKITSRTQPSSGPFSGRWVYEWTEQTFSIDTGTPQDADYPRKGFYNSATDYGNPIIEPNNSLLSVGSYVWTRMKGAVAGRIVYETVAFGGGTPNSAADCSSLNGLIREGSCFTLSLAAGDGSCACVSTQSSSMTWDSDASAFVSTDYFYGCSPGVVTTWCPDGAPRKYKIVVTGFTGGSTGFNGTYTVTWTSGETWSGTTAGVDATLVQTADGSFTLTLDDGSNAPTWTVTGITDCCADIDLALADGDGTTDPPASLTAQQVTACGLGTPYTAYLDLCDDTCMGPQPRLIFRPATGSGAASITFSRIGCTTGGGQFSTSDPIFCTDDADTDCGENSVIATVTCTDCCDNAPCSSGIAWSGVGYYSTSTGCCVYYSSDPGDSVTLCDGPYESNANCQDTVIIVFDCCPDPVVLPRRLCIAVTPGTCDYTSTSIAEYVGEILGAHYWYTHPLGEGDTKDDKGAILQCSGGQLQWAIGWGTSSGGSTCYGSYGPINVDCDAILPVSHEVTAVAVDPECYCTSGETTTITVTDASLGCTEIPAAASFNCLESGTCVDPGDGTGEFSTEADCLASCSSSSDSCVLCTDIGTSASLSIPDGAQAGVWTGTFADGGGGSFYAVLTPPMGYGGTMDITLYCSPVGAGQMSMVADMSTTYATSQNCSTGVFTFAGTIVGATGNAVLTNA